MPFLMEQGIFMKILILIIIIINCWKYLLILKKGFDSYDQNIIMNKNKI